jgi:hypothetical protein
MDSLNSIKDFLLKWIKWFSENDACLVVPGLFLAIFTLREMAKQRQESYKPRLMIREKNFFLQKNSNGTPCFLKENSEPITNFGTPHFFLELNNIGLGSAHDIVVKWNYDQQRIVNRLREYSQRTKLLKVNPNYHYEYIFDQYSPEGFGFFIKECKAEESSISFLDAKEHVGLKFPDTLHFLLTMASYLEWEIKRSKPIVENDLGKVAIVFEFFDIGGKKQTQKLTMLTTAYSHDEDCNHNYGCGKLSFKTNKVNLASRIRSRLGMH